MTDQTTIERLVAYTNRQYGWACTPEDMLNYRKENGEHVFLLYRGIKGTPAIRVKDADLPEHIDPVELLVEADGDVTLGGVFPAAGVTDETDDDLVKIDEPAVDLNELVAVSDFMQAGLSEEQEQALHKAGFKTFYDLDVASAKSITDVPGIGKSALTKIRDYCS